MATYKKRKDGRYARQIVTGIKDGKPVKKTIYAKTLKELDKKYREFMDLKDRGIVLQEDKITLSELSHRWMENIKKPNLKPQSYRNLQSQIRVMNRYIGHIRIKDLSIATLEAYRSTLVSEGKIDQFNKAIASLRSILDYGITLDILVRNVAKNVSALHYSGKRKKRAMTDRERKAVLDAELAPWERCFLDILLFAGLRRSEALALTIDDINFKERTISVCKTLVLTQPKEKYVQESTKTSSGTRVIPIPEYLFLSLKKYCSNRIHGPLFHGMDGDYITSGTFDKRWKAIKRKISVSYGEELPEDFTPHLFRHTYASDLYKSGVDIKAAQYLLGHSDVKTTLDTYTHFGYVDVKISCLENYYEEVKRKSEEKESLENTRICVLPGIKSDP